MDLSARLLAAECEEGFSLSEETLAKQQALNFSLARYSLLDSPDLILASECDEVQ
jgi:hypothetical protein